MYWLSSPYALYYFNNTLKSWMVCNKIILTVSFLSLTLNPYMGKFGKVASVCVFYPTGRSTNNNSSTFTIDCFENWQLFVGSSCTQQPSMLLRIKSGS